MINKKIKISKTKLKNVYLIEHYRFKDFRGSFVESYNFKDYKKIYHKTFLQDDFSFSKKNVLRGFHGEKFIDKIVSCIFGEIFIVIVDYDKESKTFLNVFKMRLKGSDNLQIFVPKMHGIAHYVISSKAIFHYKQTGYYNIKNQFSLKWDDPRIKVKWPFNKTAILSKRDKA
jgi:dTDP-4-dehydrorhamnose 3,5-epimerase